MSNIEPTSLKTSSKRISEKTGKRHDHVLRDIRKMIADLLNTSDSPKLGSDYEIVSYQNAGKEYTEEIRLNEKLSLCLASGYSTPLRMAIISDWALLKAESQKPLSQLEILQQSVNLLIENSKKIEQLEEKVKVIEAKTTTSTMDYFTIMGYWSLNNKAIDVKEAAKMGREAAYMCNQMGFVMGQMPDPRFGRVKTYPVEVLKSVFEKNL